jgi:hypothetical protein
MFDTLYIFNTSISFTFKIIQINFFLCLGGLFKSKFPKTIVPKNFEIENGVLGLERDIYLSVVKIPNSQIVRKV